MILSYGTIIVMTAMGAFASLNLKKASGSSSLISLLKDKYLYIGGFLYAVSAVLNIIVLRVLDYSVVLPLTSITYIWTMIISYVLLGEKIGLRKIAGLCCIVTGAVLMALA